MRTSSIYKYFLLLIVWLFAVNSLIAQDFKLVLRGVDADLFQSSTQIPQQYNSFIECKDWLTKAQLTLIKQGYLTTSVDSLVWNDSIASAFVIVGKKYTWAKIKNNNIPSSLLTQARFDERHFLNKPIEVKQLYPLGFSEAVAPFFSRILIGIEFALGFLLLHNHFLKRITIPATLLMLAVFTIHLTIVTFVSGGSSGNKAAAPRLAGSR